MSKNILFVIDEVELKYFADEIKSNKELIKKFDDCSKQSKIIENITQATKMDKLSEEQLQLCMQL